MMDRRIASSSSATLKETFVEDMKSQEILLTTCFQAFLHSSAAGGTVSSSVSNSGLYVLPFISAIDANFDNLALNSLAFRNRYFGGFRLIHESFQQIPKASTSTLRFWILNIGEVFFLTGGGGWGCALDTGGGGTTLNLILGLVLSGSSAAQVTFLKSDTSPFSCSPLQMAQW